MSIFIVCIRPVIALCCCIFSSVKASWAGAYEGQLD